MGKIYAVIDTNIIVSALIKWESNPGKIIEFISEMKITPVIHRKILEEYNEVCSRKKFKFNKRKAKTFINQIKKKAVFLDRSSADEIFEHESDAVFYEVTLTAKEKFDDAYLVTGNGKHFPVKPFVVSPAEMVAIVERAEFQNNV